MHDGVCDLDGLCNQTWLPSPAPVWSVYSRRLVSGVVASRSRKIMSASTPSTIISTIWSAFEKGKASGDLLFFPPQIHTHDLYSGIDVGSKQLSPLPPTYPFCVYCYYFEIRLL